MIYLHDIIIAIAKKLINWSRSSDENMLYHILRVSKRAKSWANRRV